METDGENPQHGGFKRFCREDPPRYALVAEGKEGINGLTLSNAMHLSSWLKRPVDIPSTRTCSWRAEQAPGASRKKESKEITFSTEGTY